MIERNFFEKNPKLVITCLILTGIIFSDFLLANIYKVINNNTFYNKITNPSNIQEKKYRISSNIYHHDLQKNINVPGFWGTRTYPMITNSLGFRDQEIQEIPTKSSKYRIVFMGDSFVEGTGVAYPNSFVGILAKEYSSKYDILNAGVVSYAPTVYYLKSRYLIEDAGLKFDEMILLIDISDISDEMETYANYGATKTLDLPLTEVISEVPERKSIKQFFRDNSILYVIPRWIKSGNINSATASLDLERNSVLNHRRALWTVNKAYYDQYGQAGLKKAKINVLKLKELLDKHHIKLSLVVYPWPTQIYYNDLNSIQVKEWQSFCEQNSINFVNLFPDFIHENTESNKKTILEYYIKGDMHWNEKGNQKVADLLERKLKVFSSN